ncbi:MAG TPA: tryptophan--tRNA ligase [Acidimicrobiales bacterium]|nr:tryptophan--tRNA ligase [Acidimicrobiales bacterium]
MTRVFSGVQPSGALHLGNYLGAFRQWAADQWEFDCFYCVVDLHGLTVEFDPADLRRRTLETAVGFLAAGVEPEQCTLFVQSHVHEHAELAWLIECTASFGELSRMTQFKEKSHGRESVKAGLFTYPALMAADILLYDADRVPVGDDQRQHLELTRDVALRFNHRYGETFVVPEAAVPRQAARVMDLQHPGSKMSKSAESPQGTIDLLDTPEQIAQKVRRAVTDTDGEVRYDPEHKPGLSNLLELMAAVTGRSIDDVAAAYDRYGPLKADLAEALVEALGPVRERYETYSSDPAEITALLDQGAEKAAGVASKTLARAKDAMGLLPRG